MIVLDTNVLSDLMGGGSEAVRQWLSTVPGSSLHTTAINRAEIGFGIARLPDGQRKDDLATRAAALFDEVENQTLPFDAVAADRYASIVATREANGRPIGVLDAQIASIAAARRATLATRNVADFAACGIVVVNPFDPS